jgi:HEPN domain-containing protein
MNPLTLEWVDKAEGDYLTANREYRVRKAPNYDAVCFHAQQASEKYLKAVLQENAKSIPRIHSLAELLALVSSRFKHHGDLCRAISLSGYVSRQRRSKSGIVRGWAGTFVCAGKNWTVTCSA